jgi:hypothetical protein
MAYKQLPCSYAGLVMVIVMVVIVRNGIDDGDASLGMGERNHDQQFSNTI